MKMRCDLQAFLWMLCAFSGCSSSQSYAIGQAFPANRPVRGVDVAILRSDTTGDYTVIGRVHVHSLAPTWLAWGRPSQEGMLAKLKAKAAQLHADGIIDVRRYSRSQFEWEEEHLMGTAVIVGPKEKGQ